MRASFVLNWTNNAFARTFCKRKRQFGLEKGIVSLASFHFSAVAVPTKSKLSKLECAKRTLVHTSRYGPIDIPRDDLYSFLTADFASFRKRVAAVDAPTGRECTYEELQRDAVSLGSALIKRGVQPGDVVGVCSPNSIEYMTTMLGVAGICATVSPINQNLNAEEMEAQMREAGMKVVVTTNELLPLVAEASAKVDGAKPELIVVGGASGVDTFDSLLADAGDAFPSESARRSIVDPKNHVAIIPFSSGTTGMPKGVMITHYNMIANTCQVSAHDDLVGPEINGSRTRILSILPMWHSYMILSVMVLLRHGNMFSILPKFEPISFLEAISKYKLDFLPIVPPLILFLAKHPLVAKYDLSSVKDVLSGAAPLGPDLQAELSARLGISRIRQAWGMSELSPGVTIGPASEPIPGSCGVVIPNTELKVVEVGTRNTKSDGDGEIAVRGPQVMKGYLNNLQATRDMIDDEGWLYTGDIGHVDENGHLVIVDRLKELIKYKGHQVAPAELEGVLLTHPAVADAAVIGVPDEAAGEVPRAFVQLKTGVDVAAADVADFVNSRVGAFSWLRGGVEFVPGIPKAQSGKILRKELREKYKAEIEMSARADN